VLAALGNDGGDYLKRFEGLAIDNSSVRIDPDLYTAQAIIITDADNNQITAFHPGAMAQSHLSPVPARADLAIGIIAPDGRDAMLVHAKQLHAAGVPFIFDPGQQLPMFDGTELRHFIEQARWVALNDYEARMLCERTGTDLQNLSCVPGLDGVVVTLAMPRGSPVCRPARCSTRPAAATRSEPACCSGLSAAGR